MIINISTFVKNGYFVINLLRKFLVKFQSITSLFTALGLLLERFTYDEYH